MVIGYWLPWGGKETLIISLGNAHRGLRVESHLPASRGQMWPVHHCIPHAECEFGFLRFSVSPMGDSYALQVENQECRHVTGYEEKERILECFPYGVSCTATSQRIPTHPTELRWSVICSFEDSLTPSGRVSHSALRAITYLV